MVFVKRIAHFFLFLPALLLAGILVQRVFAASYTIYDGGRTYHYTGFPGSPDSLLERAGVSLEDLEGYTREANTITLRRVPSVTLFWHGQPMTVPTQGETVQALLQRLGLQTDENDMLSLPQDSLLTGGMVLRVDQILTREECSTRILPHDTKEVFCAALPQGTTQVLVAGRDGALKRREWVRYVNAQEAERALLEEKRTLAPVTELVAVGTGIPQPAETSLPVVSGNELILPTGERVRFKRVDYVRATAYTHTDPGCTSTTATNTRVHRGTVAVDPRYIPYGTRMFIMASDGSYIYGLAQAEDCGGDIKGDRVDLYLPSYEACVQFGRRRCTVYFLE